MLFVMHKFGMRVMLIAQAPARVSEVWKIQCTWALNTGSAGPSRSPPGERLPYAALHGGIRIVQLPLGAAARLSAGLGTRLGQGAVGPADGVWRQSLSRKAEGRRNPRVKTKSKKVRIK